MADAAYAMQAERAEAKKAKRPRRFTKVEAGWYATEDGTYAVVSDGYEKGAHIGSTGDWKNGSGYEGFIGGEWALVSDPKGRLRTNPELGENLDWFSTKREAVAAAPKTCS